MAMTTDHFATATATLKETLARASAWMFASLALQPPTAESRAILEALIPSLPSSLQTAAARIAAFRLDDWEPEYFSVLGPAGCPACESSYERAAQASRGPMLADISGCYQAFAYAPDVREVPDHASVEAGFLGYLAMKIAFAEHAGQEDAAEIAREAYAAFQRDHVGRWFDDFRDALAETGSAQASAIAEFLGGAVAA
jgi:nitrate reductase assembly molybdenum cofactor insertion protein NarJ